MKVVILGWGSLIWDPRDLPREGIWHSDGPVLPIEFSRVSQDCRLTLVIDEAYGERITTQYVSSPRSGLDDAISDLRSREGTTKRNIGYVDLKHDRNSDHLAACRLVKTWASDKEIDAVIWTALSSNFEDETGEEFSVARAVEYLNGLPSSAAKNALRYIQNAPETVTTPLRRKLIELGKIEK